MKLKLPCVDCMTPGKEGNADSLISSLPLGDDCIYEVKCSAGHSAVIHTQNFKFDLLFESGIQALRDGYHREAVTSFAVALERFYEFSVGILIIDKLKPQNSGQFDLQALEKYVKLWKNPLKLSEKQLGAFYSLYFNEFDESPMLFDEAFSKSLKHKTVPNPTNFRNRVVHEGYVPTYDEAVQYGEAVHHYMDALLGIYTEKDRMRELPRTYYMTFLELALSFMKRKEDIRHLPGTGIPTFLQPSFHADRSIKNLSDYVKYVHKDETITEGVESIQVLATVAM